MEEPTLTADGQVFGSDDATRQFAERYFRVQHTDLLFANAAIFVEGVAERMLVPLFMERDYESLNRRYVSFLDIGGSHAHRLKPLIEKLRIPTIVITDIDPVEVKVGAKGQTVRVAVANTGQSGLECGNATLRNWHPKLLKLDDFKSPKPEHLTWTEVAGCMVRFAWQLPVTEADDTWPSSFEDSLILSNIEWFKGLAKEKVDKDGKNVEPPTGALGAAATTVAVAKTHLELASALHTLMHKSFSKGDFAASIFEMVAAGEPIVCPKYIANALDWLQRQLDPSADMVL
jgi:hypothetical protein